MLRRVAIEVTVILRQRRFGSRSQKRSRDLPLEKLTIVRHKQHRLWIKPQHVSQPGSVIAMDVRDHDRVQMRQVHMHLLYVRAEYSDVVSRVEENSLTVVLDQRGVAPVLLEISLAAEGVVKDRNAVLRANLSAKDEQPQEHQSDGERAPCHRIPPFVSK